MTGRERLLFWLFLRLEKKVSLLYPKVVLMFLTLVCHSEHNEES
jgi:hypothetical protein